MLPKEDETKGKPSKKWDGITVDGKPLTAFFTDKHTEDLSDAVRDEQKLKAEKKKRRRVYIRQKPESEKQRRSKMTVADQSKVNKENFKSLLDKTEALQKRIILYLLSGANFNAEELKVWEEKRGKRIGKQQVWSALSAMMRTDLGRFIRRDKEKYKGNIMFRYSMDDEGLELEPAQAFQLVKQIDTMKRKKAKEKKKPAKAKKGKAAIKKKEEKKVPTRAVGKDVEITIMEGKPAEVNVKLGGRVDFYFHFKLG